MTAKWIKKLPPGKYNTNDLRKITGLKQHLSIKIVMLRHGATVEKIICPKTDRYINVFTWDGYKEGDKK